jgi:hypothetical protein
VWGAAVNIECCTFVLTAKDKMSKISLLTKSDKPSESMGFMQDHSRSLHQISTNFGPHGSENVLLNSR